MLTIGLVNNMAPAAIAPTERHFREVLAAAAGDIPFRIRWFRFAGARPANYEPTENLWNAKLDGLIVTGVEPKAATLPEEPFWPALVRLIEWAQCNTASTICSCLAAHAAVLYLDGVQRRPHQDKIFGIFESIKVTDHPLLENLQASWRVPHSRWNDLEESDLTASGYTVLAKSLDAGVDLFVKQFAQSLFVFIQTHPEYQPWTLRGEYRRDLTRFDETQRYPSIPQNYFDNDIVAELAAIQGDPTERRTQSLAILQRAPVLHDWNVVAVGLYRNWLIHLLSQQNETSVGMMIPAASPDPTVHV